MSDQSIDRVQREKVWTSCSPTRCPRTPGAAELHRRPGRARQLPQILEQVSTLAAEARDSVSPRCARILYRRTARRACSRAVEATGKKVEVKALVDPDVMGGVVAKIGDTVIDGTIRHKLEQLKDQVRR